MTIIEAVSAPDAKGTTNQVVRGAGALFRTSPGCGPNVAALLADRQQEGHLKETTGYSSRYHGMPI